MTFGKGHHLHLIDGSAFIFRAYHALPPLTRKSDGMPIGLHIIGPHGAEARVLQASAAFEEARPWSDKRPIVS